MTRQGTKRVYEMAAHLLLSEKPFSRNKNLEAYEDPRFKSAIALYRRLRALLSDLERARADGSKLVVLEETHAGRPSMRLEITGPRSRRTTWLERPAWDVLMLHPGARAATSALLARVAA